MQVELPYPPTVNTYWRSVRGRVLISANGRAYREEVGLVLMLAKVVKMVGRLGVEVDVYPPDLKRRDLDNVQKALFDSLAHGGVYDDDSQIDDIHLCRCDVVPGGKVVVRIRQL